MCRFLHIPPRTTCEGWVCSGNVRGNLMYTNARAEPYGKKGWNITQREIMCWLHELDVTKELTVKTMMRHGEGKSENNPTMRSNTQNKNNRYDKGRGKAEEQPNLEDLTQNKTNRCKWRREKRTNNPTTRSQKRNTQASTRDEIDATRTNQQPHGKRWWTYVIRTKRNEPETTWETLVDVCKQHGWWDETIASATTRNRMGDTGGARVGEKNWIR